jgi:adenylate cyclase class 2
MPVEIEVKAWADDPETTKSALSQFAEYQGEFLKYDVYWFPSSASPVSGTAGVPASGVRIRQEERETGSQATIVTYKAKEVRDGIEINQEWEFQVSGRADFEKFLDLMGLAPGYTKKKTGFAWNYQGITAELTQVETLGWFVELEILAGDDAKITVKSARKRLLDLLKRIGITGDRIEPRYYSEMLKTHADSSPR